MTGAWSKLGIEFSLNFVSLVGELSILLVHLLSLKCSVEALALWRRSRSGETFCGVGSRRGEEEVPSVVSVTGEPACRLQSLLVIADALFPILLTVGYSDGERAFAAESVVASEERFRGLDSLSP